MTARITLRDLIKSASDTLAETTEEHFDSLPPDHLFALDSAYYELTGFSLFSERQRHIVHAGIHGLKSAAGRATFDEVQQAITEEVTRLVTSDGDETGAEMQAEYERTVAAWAKQVRELQRTIDSLKARLSEEGERDAWEKIVAKYVEENMVMRDKLNEVSAERNRAVEATSEKDAVIAQLQQHLDRQKDLVSLQTKTIDKLLTKISDVQDLLGE